MSQIRKNYRVDSYDDKVVYLSNRHRQPTQMAEKLPRQPQTKRNWRSLIISGVGLIAVVLSCIPLISTYQNFKANQAELEQAKTEYQVAQDYHSDLLAQSELLQDPQYLAEIARRDYYYSKPGEIIFDLGEQESPQADEEGNESESSLSE